MTIFVAYSGKRARPVVTPAMIIDRMTRPRWLPSRLQNFLNSVTAPRLRLALRRRLTRTPVLASASLAVLASCSSLTSFSFDCSSSVRTVWR